MILIVPGVEVKVTSARLCGSVEGLPEIQDDVEA